MKLQIKSGLLTALIAAIPTAAYAHTGIGQTSGFAHGFMHPTGGLDHILAMVAVGIFAALLGGRARWLVPTTFVLMMAFGGLIGIEGIALPFVEIGIAASIVVLGLAVALLWNPPTAVAMAVVGLFAVFHGHAHGSEIPMDASGLQYALGFMPATALLHIAGIGIGISLGWTGANSRLATQIGGGGTALAGAAIMTGLL
jgi:urease accessory protein